MRSLPARLDQQKEARLRGGCVLWTLLESFQDSLCQEVHDKIDGFMGLSTDCGDQGLTIDYTKSVEQLYRDVIRFYWHEFGQDSSLHRAPQLIKLGEFLQNLLGKHPGANKCIQEATLAQEQYSTQNQVEPVSSTNISMSTCNPMVIIRFPSSNYPLATQYRISELIDYIDGKIPYSHLGYWRDFVESDFKGVSTIDSAQAYTNVSYTHQKNGRKIDRPTVFLAWHIINRPALNEDNQMPLVVGIAPGGSQIGDIVFSVSTN